MPLRGYELRATATSRSTATRLARPLSAKRFSRVIDLAVSFLKPYVLPLHAFVFNFLPRNFVDTLVIQKSKAVKTFLFKSSYEKHTQTEKRPVPASGTYIG